MTCESKIGRSVATDGDAPRATGGHEAARANTHVMPAPHAAHCSLAHTAAILEQRRRVGERRARLGAPACDAAVARCWLMGMSVVWYGETRWFEVRSRRRVRLTGAFC